MAEGVIALDTNAAAVGELVSAKGPTNGRYGSDVVVDLLKHIWVPVVVIGVAGTAGMIRVMRANLLDELNKPYVVTARAKGVRPLTLRLSPLASLIHISLWDRADRRRSRPPG